MATNPAGVGFHSDANVRIVAHTALVQGTATPSTWHYKSAKLPTALNTGPVVCLTDLNFFEPNYFGYVKGTNPTTVTGSAPADPYATYMAGKIISGVVNDISFAWAAGIITAGELVVIADVYGRVNNLANLGLMAGAGWIYPVGIALSAAGAANDLIEVLIGFQPFVI